MGRLADRGSRCRTNRDGVFGRHPQAIIDAWPVPPKVTRVRAKTYGTFRWKDYRQRNRHPDDGAV